jgi:hypothetical protein
MNERAKVFEKRMSIAFNNLAVAQQRNMLRYTKTRSGTFAPKLQRFAARDFLYLKRQKADSLDPRVGRSILRVKSIGIGGRLVLEGRDKNTVTDHVKNWASCHLPNLDIWRNPRLVRGDVDQSCQVCHQTTYSWLDHVIVRRLRLRLAYGVFRSAFAGDTRRELVLSRV